MKKNSESKLIINSIKAFNPVLKCGQTISTQGPDNLLFFRCRSVFVIIIIIQFAKY